MDVIEFLLVFPADVVLAVVVLYNLLLCVVLLFCTLFNNPKLHEVFK